MASLTRAKRVVNPDFATDAAFVGVGYSLSHVFTEIVRSEVVNFQFPLANAIYAFGFAGATRYISGGRRARLLALGMVASGLSTAWSDFTSQ